VEIAAAKVGSGDGSPKRRVPPSAPERSAAVESIAGLVGAATPLAQGSQPDTRSVILARAPARAERDPGKLLLAEPATALDVRGMRRLRACGGVRVAARRAPSARRQARRSRDASETRPDALTFEGAPSPRSGPRSLGALCRLPDRGLLPP